ncbi:unannotated protein [freshwater metagenome]|uniref:Unannotated protein n=1 Tax=freshwater metagenome TaxID=449393 RepID=A0A6J6TKZ5_9ZZZZ
MVEIALAEPAERLDIFLQRHRGAWLAGELLSGHHVLAKEALNAAGPVDQLLVFLRQLIDTENRNDVLEILVTLQDPDDFLSDPIMLLTQDCRVENR